MNLVLRVVFGVILVIIFLSIMLSTFFTPPRYAELPNLKEFSMTGSLSGAYMVNLSAHENIYSDSDLTGVIGASGATLSFSTDGRYLSSLRQPGKQYAISGTGFLLKQEGIGEVYIDSITSPGRVFIIPVNTSVELILRSEDGTQEYSNVYLSPNMYLEFQTNRAKYLKNADRLRISTVFKLGYIGNLNEIDSSDTIGLKYLQKENIFFTGLSILREQDEFYKRELSYFKKQEIIGLPGSDFIERYAHLFVNAEKKKIFYKNKVLEGYIQLLNSKSLDNGNIQQIKRDMQSVAKIDTQAYDLLLTLQENIERNLYGEPGYDYVIPKIGFALLSDSILKEGDLYYPLYTYSLFTNYNRDGNFLPEISRNFFLSFQTFSNSLDNKVGRYDYFLYFLEQQLAAILEVGVKDTSPASISHIITNYVNIAGNAEYESRNQKITQIYSVGNILSGVEKFIKKTYFLDQRNESKLLIMNSEQSLGGSVLIELRESIENLFIIYEENKSVLDKNSKRDALLQISIEASERLLEEYLVALESYERYEDLYDISKKNSLGLDTFGGSEDISLSESKAKEYLSQFAGSTLSASLIEVFVDHYKIDNYIVSGKSFSFDLYPESGNKMGNISIDGEKKTTQYKLDLIQGDWEERKKSAQGEDKDMFEFSRFFIITFFNLENNQQEIFIRDVKQQEDKAEIVFKRDILLGNKGEFHSIKEVVDIKYENISLIKKDTNYDIFLQDVTFGIPILLKEKREVIKGGFNSQYVFNSEDHYFTDFYSQFIIPSTTQKDNYYLDGKQVLFPGKIHIGDMVAVLTAFMSELVFTNNVYSSISGFVSGEINISYNHFSKKVSLKFDSGGKKYTILIKDGSVDAIYSGTSKVQAENITISDLINYIK